MNTRGYAPQTCNIAHGLFYYMLSRWCILLYLLVFRCVWNVREVWTHTQARPRDTGHGGPLFIGIVCLGPRSRWTGEWSYCMLNMEWGFWASDIGRRYEDCTELVERRYSALCADLVSRKEPCRKSHCPLTWGLWHPFLTAWPSHQL